MKVNTVGTEYKTLEELKKRESTLEELRTTDNWHQAIFVFTADSFDGEFDETSRSYVVNEDCPLFKSQINTAVTGTCLDFTDIDLRLDYYMSSAVEKPWKIEKIYILEEYISYDVQMPEGVNDNTIIYKATDNLEYDKFMSAMTPEFDYDPIEDEISE